MRNILNLIPIALTILGLNLPWISILKVSGFSIYSRESIDQFSSFDKYFVVNIGIGLILLGLNILEIRKVYLSNVFKAVILLPLLGYLFVLTPQIIKVTDKLNDNLSSWNYSLGFYFFLTSILLTICTNYKSRVKIKINSHLVIMVLTFYLILTSMLFPWVETYSSSTSIWDTMFGTPGKRYITTYYWLGIEYKFIPWLVVFSQGAAVILTYIVYLDAQWFNKRWLYLTSFPLILVILICFLGFTNTHAAFYVFIAASCLQVFVVWSINNNRRVNSLDQKETPTDDNTELNKLVDLLNKGLIDENEFKSLKSRLK